MVSSERTCLQSAHRKRWQEAAVELRLRLIEGHVPPNRSYFVLTRSRLHIIYVTQDPACFTCGKVGYWSKDGWRPQKSQEQQQQCQQEEKSKNQDRSKCGKKGHWSRDCWRSFSQPTNGKFREGQWQEHARQRCERHSMNHGSRKKNKPSLNKK